MRGLQEPGRNPRAPARSLISTTEYIGRFAPSPSGPLHAGSLVSALASWLDARAHGGRWLLRIEDVDSERCKPEHAATIRHQLRALSLHWDAELPPQQQRLARYDHILSEWLETGVAYACRCTRRDLSPYRGRGETCYPGLCRDRGLPREGNAIRYRLPEPSTVDFTDRLLGPKQQCVARQCGDVVLQRRQGDYTYQFAVSVDDAEQGITHVVRGEDLLASTGRQMLLIRQLGLPAPRYLHHPLLRDAQGQKLSKSTGATALNLEQPRETLSAALRELGITPPPDAPRIPCAQLLEQALSRWTLLTGGSSGKMGF